MLFQDVKREILDGEFDIVTIENTRANAERAVLSAHADYVQALGPHGLASFCAVRLRDREVGGRLRRASLDIIYARVR